MHKTARYINVIKKFGIYYIYFYRTYSILLRKRLNFKLGKSYERNFTKFIILCEGRTGSTLLHTYLNSNPAIQSYGEMIASMPKLITLEKDLFPPHPKNIQAVGHKIFYSYKYEDNRSSIFEEFIKNSAVKIIHLKRKDTLRMYISFLMAWTTKQWSSTQQSASYRHTKVAFNSTDYQKFKNNYFKLQSEMEVDFKDHSTLTVYYEDLWHDSQNTLALIQRFLEVKPRKLFTLLTKQNNLPLEELVKNYADVLKVTNN